MSSGLMIGIGVPLVAVVLIAVLALWAARGLKAISGEDEGGSPLGSDPVPGRVPDDHEHAYDEDGDCTVCGHDLWAPQGRLAGHE